MNELASELITIMLPKIRMRRWFRQWWIDFKGVVPKSDSEIIEFETAWIQFAAGKMVILKDA